MSLFGGIRKAVSGSKKRYEDDVYNLDLTYISPRIIAMSMPGEGFLESTYRNKMSDVSKFLGEHHGDQYFVINLSQKEYSIEKFGKRVEPFCWVDHHSPYLPVMFKACYRIHQWLKGSSELKTRKPKTCNRCALSRWQG